MSLVRWLTSMDSDQRHVCQVCAADFIAFALAVTKLSAASLDSTE